MREVNLKLCVISDLHCHPQRETYEKNNTHLFTDKLRSPVRQHPVQSLHEIINENELETNIILCPGDFADKSNKQGLISGWQYVQEIGRALKCNDIIATLGNHDVDSRNVSSKYSFEIAKKVKQDFPLPDKYIGSFWDKGYTFIEQDDVQILVLNTAHYHTHQTEDEDNPIVKGKIDIGSIEEIERYLREHDDNNKIKIFLCHHHPVQHSRNELGEYDFVENGDQLVAVLGKFKFDLVVHGHKHDPWLRYHRTTLGYNIPILASGSFSASGQADQIGMFNYFHLIEIQKINGTVRAKMRTWEYLISKGWEISKGVNFKPYTGFGYTNNESLIANKIETYLSTVGDTLVTWDDIIIQAPEIENLTPDQIDTLQTLLLDKNIFTNPEIGSKPKHCYKHG